jgi:pimeloyl-ACP methyl ester carboxylesterase
MNKVRSQDGTAIAFDRLGEGPPVVLVGGALEVRSDPKMRRLAERLASRHTVFSYDRRGRGDSGDTPAHVVGREVEDLEAVIEQAGGSASVLGISTGAVLALEAGSQGLEIEKLALYEPPLMVDERAPRSPADHEAQLYSVPTGRIRSVAVPTLIIARENSDPRLRRAAQALWVALPDVQHRILEGQTPDLDPGALAPLLERFFDVASRHLWTTGPPLV